MDKRVTHITRIEFGLTPEILLKEILLDRYTELKRKNKLKNVNFEEYENNIAIPKIPEKGEMVFDLYGEDFRILFLTKKDGKYYR